MQTQHYVTGVAWRRGFLCLALICVSSFLVSSSDSRRVVSAQGSPVQLVPVLSGLSSPVFVTNAHDGTNRLFIVEQTGKIKVLQPGSSTPTVFLDLTSSVVSGGEQGLLGLAFHPNYRTNGRFFVSYTRTPDGTSVFAEHHVSASNPNVADTAEIPILTVSQPFANHNGGMIVFGPDGFLYIGLGDGGSGDDPGNRAQNVNELLGKILRINIDVPNGSIPYSSPPDNPFFGPTTGRDEIYALGLRNPWRFSFDRVTGNLYAGDVGQGAREEVDIITKGGNYGWRIYEGSCCRPGTTAVPSDPPCPMTCTPPPCGTGGFVCPITEYVHPTGCSITGGYVYRGSRSTLPTGTYVFADFCTGQIFTLTGTTQAPLIDTSINISSFGEDEAGEIYVVGLGGTVDRLTGTGLPSIDQGFHDSVGCGNIVGWAWDANRPNGVLNVDVYDGQTLLGTTPANLFREDLVNAGVGNGFHGFSFTVPPSVRNGQQHQIRVRFAGTGVDLQRSPRSLTCGGGAVLFQGFHDGAGCNTISGWDWDANDPNSPINVDIYDGANLIATVPSQQFRPDLVSSGIGNGFHGFSFTVPPSLKDGQPHSIRVRFPGTAQDLSSTPRTIQCTGAPPVYAGVHEVANCNVISGWAWDQNDPNSPINVAIYADNLLIATVLAIQFRQDLVDSGIGNGFHAFSFNVPASLKNGQPHSIRVRFSGTSSNLSSTPRSITCN